MNKKNQNPEALAPILIVGVGASAGGLEAFSLFLESLPSDTNMAFVLVQHLYPSHESNLSKILSSLTHMLVIEVTEGLEALPNHVYVIPPNSQMTINKNILHLIPRSKSPTQFLPIDHFFKSLAVELKASAIGIVLQAVEAMVRSE
jgi:two-component system CheB/CheR fusion protein